MVELCKPRLSYVGKKVLILGGSKGLGLALAIELKKAHAKVTVLARGKEKLADMSRSYGVDTICSDIGRPDVFGSKKLGYEIVFSCVGKCVPGFFVEQEVKKLDETMTLNLFDTYNVVKQLITSNRRPFTLVLVASSLSLYTFPGYVSYAASKAALSSFFETIRNELRSRNIKTKIYYTSTITSESFYEENRIKPQQTIKFESISYGKSCDTYNRAHMLLEQLGSRDRISSDLLTYLVMINVECETFIDLLFLPLAMVVNQVLRLVISIYFRNLGNTIDSK